MLSQIRDITNLPVSQLPLQVQAWDSLKRARDNGVSDLPQFVWLQVSPEKGTKTSEIINAIESFNKRRKEEEA